MALAVKCSISALSIKLLPPCLSFFFLTFPLLFSSVFSNKVVHCFSPGPLCVGGGLDHRSVVSLDGRAAAV